MWQLDLIAACAVLMAIEPLTKLGRALNNLAHRRMAHWAHEERIRRGVSK
jgi:hypothetical protein